MWTAENGIFLKKQIIIASIHHLPEDTLAFWVFRDNARAICSFIFFYGMWNVDYSRRIFIADAFSREREDFEKRRP